MLNSQRSHHARELSPIMENHVIENEALELEDCENTGTEQCDRLFRHPSETINPWMADVAWLSNR